MDALQKSYLSGLSRLKEEAKANGGDCELLDVLQMRLKGNINNISRYGRTRENDQQEAEILVSLNEYTRNFYDVSFDDYCQSSNHQSTPATVMQQALVSTEMQATESVGQLVISSNFPQLMKRASIFLSNVNLYIATLQENVQRARDIFNDSAIGQEQCKDALSLFRPFDYHDFPEHNQSLYRAKVRLRALNEQVNELISSCEICDDVDRYAKLNIKKVQNLIGTLDYLYHEIGNVQKLLSNVDISCEE